ncbi:hypothetical protein H8E77_08685 [bacterium]|nr:hypothetical protein [bacterium]
METKTIDEMTEEEVDSLLDDITEATFDQVTPEAFWEAMCALEMYQHPRVIELSGTYADGNVLFDILHGTAEILNGTGP